MSPSNKPVRSHGLAFGGSLSIASMLTRCSQNVLKGSFRRSSFARPVLCDKFLSRAFFHSLIVGPSTSSRSIEHPLRSPKVVTSNRHLATSPIAVENEEIDNSFVEENGEKWRMVSGVIVERTPRLTHVDPAWKTEWRQFQDELDIKKRKKIIPLDWILSGRDKEELLNKATFEPHPRKQPSDFSNDRRSVNRALVSSAYLIVKKPRDKHAWGFPQGGLEPMETIRQAAERELAEECGKHFDTYFLGNAPIGHLQYEYPEKEQTEFKGSKVFLMHSMYVGGDIEVDNKEIVDYAWVTREEFPEYFSGEMLELLDKIIFEFHGMDNKA